MNSPNWNARLYDANHKYVSKYGRTLLELVAAKQGESILDLGCGTGDLTQALYQAEIDVVGVDNSPTMIQQATEKYPHISFDIADIVHLPYENEFDAVFSNAALHWVKAAEQALENIYTSLKQGGRFVAEFGGEDNVQKITSAIMSQTKKAGYPMEEDEFPWYFPSIAAYTTIMERVGFRVVYAKHYDRFTMLDGKDGLKNWLSMFAIPFFQHVPLSKRDKLITNIEMDLRSQLYKDGNWFADYKRIQVIGIKK